MEVHHLDGNHRNNRYSNWTLLHAHCHDQGGHLFHVLL